MAALSQETAWLRAATGTRVVEFYAAIGIDLPDRDLENAPVRCFANAMAHSRDDRDASCSVNLLTGLWKCFGCGESGNAYSAALARGYSEQRARELAMRHGLFLESRRGEKPTLPGERQLRRWRKALGESSAVLARLRELKGWTPGAIVRCGLGWDGERLTFPLRDRRLRIVGVARYLPGGDPKMKAMPGSKRLLFPAPEVFSRRDALFVVEGEPAAVSVRSCGLPAVAVPGAQGWRPEFVERLAGRRVVVLPDCDRPGRDLAKRVASSLVDARVVDLEPGRDDGWDVGDLVAEAHAEGGIWQAAWLLRGLAA